MDLKEFWDDSSPKKINIKESLNDMNQSSSDEGSDEDDSTTFEKMGYILIQYEDILDSENLKFMIKLYLNKVKTIQNKTINVVQQKYIFKKITHIIKQYKDDITEEIINSIVANIKGIIYLNSSAYDCEKSAKNHINNFLQYTQKIIDEYLDVMNESSVIMFINSISLYIPLHEDIIL